METKLIEMPVKIETKNIPVFIILGDKTILIDVSELDSYFPTTKDLMV